MLAKPTLPAVSHKPHAAEAPSPPAAVAVPSSRRTLLACATLLAASPLLALRPALAQATREPAVQLLHAVLNVTDLEASAAYFVEAYGMLRTRTRPGNAFVAFGSESRGEHFALELSPALWSERAQPGALHSLVLATANPAKSVARALGAGASRGGEGERCAGDAFAGCAVVGPEGVRVRFVKASSTAPRLARLVLKVPDLRAATTFYTDALGLVVVARQPGVSELAAEDAPIKVPRVLLGSKSDGSGTLLELRESGAQLPAASAASPYVFDKIAVGVPPDALDAYVKAARPFASVVKEPFAVPGIGTHVALLSAPGGATVALVDGADFEKELA